MAIQSVEKIVLTVALPMLIFERIMYPFVWLLNHVANWVAHRMGFHTASEGDDAHTEEEIRLLMEESHRQGLIDDTEVDFVDNVFDFKQSDKESTLWVDGTGSFDVTNIWGPNRGRFIYGGVKFTL